MRRWEKIFHASRNDKKARIPIFMSDKIDFRAKSTMKDNRTLYNDKGINTRRGYDLLIHKQPK